MLQGPTSFDVTHSVPFRDTGFQPSLTALCTSHPPYARSVLLAMSLMPKEAINVIAQTIGISHLSDDVAAALAPDVEYRMREVMQEAIKCMCHSKRATLTTADVDSALSLRNVEPLYGFASNDPLRFRRALGHSGLYYINDPELDFKEIMEAPLPKAPMEVSVTAHWLALEGVQPAIPENVPIEPLVPPPATDKKAPAGTPAAEEVVEIRPAVKHVLSKELQLYFEKVTEILVVGGEGALLDHALHSLASDAGLHPLVPYFTQFIQDEVTRSLEDFPLLFALMRLLHSLLLNPHIHIDPYLHQLMPSVVTCLVGKRLGGKASERHWALRDYSAKLVAFICRRFGPAYQELQQRITRTLLNTFLDPKRALTQHYGAVKGLAALGPRVLRLLVLPNLRAYLRVLAPELGPEQRNEMKRYEAWRVYAALQQAAGSCMYECLKRQFPGVVPAVPGRAKLARAARVVTDPSKAGKVMASSCKRKAPEGMEERAKRLREAFPQDDEVLELARPEGQAGVGLGGQAAARPDSKPLGSTSGLGTPPVREEGVTSGQSKARAQGGRQDGENKTSDPLAKAWKDDGEEGKAWEALIDLFGEGMMPYVPVDTLALTI